MRRVITQDPSSRPSLDHLNPLDVFLYLWVPDWCSVIQLGTDYSFVGYHSKLRAFSLQVSSQEAKGLVCIISCAGDMGFPGQVIRNVHTQVPGRGYNLKGLVV